MENSNYNMYGSLDNNKTSTDAAATSYYYSATPSDNQFYANYSSYYDPSQYQQYGFMTSQQNDTQYSQQMPVNSNYYFYPPAYSSYHYTSMQTKPASDESSELNRNSTSPVLTNKQLDYSKTTPEKQINDSGIEISPQLSFNSFNSSNASTHQTPSYNKAVSSQDESDMSDDDDENDDEEDNKENARVQSKSSSSSAASVSKPPKPYLEIIADAILSAQVKAMQLHEIYNYMENKFPYFARNVNKSWRNSVRHNLSLNECFVKAGRGSNGKGNYWRIHPLCEKEFIRGNFRRKSFKKLIKAGTMNAAQNSQNPHNYYSNASSAYQFIPPVMPTNNTSSATNYQSYSFRPF